MPSTGLQTLLETRRCRGCGASLAHRRSNARWCTNACRARAYLAAAPERQEANRQRIQRWSAENPERVRLASLRRKLDAYGLTLEAHGDLLAMQGGGCAVCGATEANGRGDRLHIDHDHTTGEVRGLLCGPCNQALGHMNDDPERLRAAADYLERNNSNGSSL